MQPSGNRFGPNIYQGLNGKDYGRSIAPQYVEDVISSTKPVYQPTTGNYSHSLGNVEVIVNHQRNPHTKAEPIGKSVDYEDFA